MAVRQSTHSQNFPLRPARRAHLKDVPAVGPVKLVHMLGGVPKLVAGEVLGGVALVTRYVGRGGLYEEEDGDDRGQRGYGG